MLSKWSCVITVPGVLYYSGVGLGALCYIPEPFALPKVCHPMACKPSLAAPVEFIHFGVWAKNHGWTLPLIDDGGRLVQNNHCGQLMAIGPVLCVISFREQQATKSIGSLSSRSIWISPREEITSKCCAMKCHRDKKVMVLVCPQFSLLDVQKVLGTKDHFLATASLHRWQ